MPSRAALGATASSQSPVQGDRVNPRPRLRRVLLRPVCSQGCRLWTLARRPGERPGPRRKGLVWSAGSSLYGAQEEPYWERRPLLTFPPSPGSDLWQPQAGRAARTHLSAGRARSAAETHPTLAGTHLAMHRDCFVAGTHPAVGWSWRGDLEVQKRDPLHSGMGIQKRRPKIAQISYFGETNPVCMLPSNTKCTLLP
ncbi:hypothetical protein NDU88_004642 [Pleurodeles waltl]|uniref:Uncharacterized protein n=1 Tax=Pleurodeles waltl TaxID=8319 RepID=A0AAV7PGD7_PLEWA|nr:hypothetical protein NDU88_004642 [Pleurodeles waltl]